MTIEYTNQSPLLFAGFYDSCLYNYDLVDEIAEYKADDSDMEYDIQNWSDFQNSIAENCAEWLFDHLPNHDIIKNMKYKELWSPREYNFMTDRLTIDCEIDMDGLKNYCLQANRDKFNKYLHDNWSSYDGFISFIKNNVVDFEQEPDTTIMIEFYLLNELDFLDGEPDENGYAEYEMFCYDLARNTIFEFLDPVENNA